MQHQNIGTYECLSLSDPVLQQEERRLWEPVGCFHRRASPSQGHLLPARPSCYRGSTPHRAMSLPVSRTPLPELWGAVCPWHVSPLGSESVLVPSTFHKAVLWWPGCHVVFMTTTSLWRETLSFLFIDVVILNILFFSFLLNLLGWHWLIKWYRFQVYTSIIHHLYYFKQSYILLLFLRFSYRIFLKKV